MEEEETAGENEAVEEEGEGEGEDVGAEEEGERQEPDDDVTQVSH